MALWWFTEAIPMAVTALFGVAMAVVGILGYGVFNAMIGLSIAFMPAFAEAPAQGIPIPPYPLTDAQIEAVLEYERTL